MTRTKNEEDSEEDSEEEEIVITKKTGKNDDRDDQERDLNTENFERKKVHVFLFIAQVNWMLMHVIFAIALREETRPGQFIDPTVLSFYRETIACFILFVYYYRQRVASLVLLFSSRLRRSDEVETDQAIVVVDDAGARLDDDALDDGKEKRRLCLQTIAVSLVFGAILAVIRSSVVLANKNSGPDITSALVLTTPVLTFFFSALFGVEKFSFKLKEHPENSMKIIAIVFVILSIWVVCKPEKGPLIFGDPHEYVAPNVAIGVTWMLTNTLASSIAIVMQRMIINANIAIDFVNAMMTGICAFWLLVVSLCVHGTGSDVWTLSAPAGLAALYGAVFPSAMNIIIFAKSAKTLGPNITARYFLLQPLMTWTLDYLVLRDAVYLSYVFCAIGCFLAMIFFASANTCAIDVKKQTKEEKLVVDV